MEGWTPSHLWTNEDPRSKKMTPRKSVQADKVALLGTAVLDFGPQNLSESSRDVQGHIHPPCPWEGQRKAICYRPWRPLVSHAPAVRIHSKDFPVSTGRCGPTQLPSPHAGEHDEGKPWGAPRHNSDGCFWISPHPSIFVRGR